MAEAAVLSFLLTAKDEASSKFKEVSKGLDEVNRHGADLGKTLGTLAKAAAGAFAGFQVGHALVGAISATQELGEATRTLTMQTGISAQSASRWIFTMEHVGLSAEDAEKSIGILAKGVFNHSETTQRALDTIGVSARDAAGNIKSIDVLLPELSDHFANAADSEAKTALAMDLFGKSGKDMLPFLNMGSEEMGRLAAEADKLGVTLSGDNVESIHKFTVAQRELEASMEGVKVKIGLALLPALIQLTEGMVHFIDRNEDAIRAFANGLPGAIEVSTQAIGTLGKGVGTLASDLGHLVGVSKDIEGAMVPLGLAMAFLFPEGALVSGIIAVHESFTIMDSDVSKASDSAISFETAWLKVLDNILSAIDDMERAILSVATIGLSTLVDYQTAAGHARNAVGEKISDLGAEKLGRGGLDVTLAQQLAMDPSKLADFTAWTTAADTAKRTTKDFADALAPGGGSGGGLSAAEREAQQGLIAMGLAFADFHAATGLGQEAFMAVIQVTKDKADLDKRMTDLTVAQNVAFMAAADSGYQFKKGLVDIGEELLKTGESVTEFLRDVAQKAYDAIRSAFGGLFGKPTKEEAQINLELAIKEEERARRKASGASDKELKALDDQISALRDRQDLESKHVNVLKAQLDAADQSLQTDAQRDFSAQLYIVAMNTQSSKLMDLSAQASLEGIARQNLINAMNNQASSMGSSQTAADPFTDAQKHWINGVADSKGEPEPFPGFKTGGVVPYTGRWGLTKGEVVLTAQQAATGGDTYITQHHTVYVDKVELHGDPQAGLQSLGVAI